MKSTVFDFVERMTGGNREVADICASLMGEEEAGDVCREVTTTEAAVLRTVPDVVTEVTPTTDVRQVHTPFVMVAPKWDTEVSSKPPCRTTGHECAAGGVYYLYTRRNWFYERQVGDTIRQMIVQPHSTSVTLPNTDYYNSLRTEQRVAVETMCRARFSILTGGPGTGKTHTIARAVQYLKEQNPTLRLSLAAPTGKAASRMVESMSRAGVILDADNGGAMTLHKLLGVNPATATTKYHHANPLPYDWLIVDEASMIGLVLMYKLLDALPASCRLTLVGDVDQLASVERGRIFGDLCRMPDVALCRLTESARFPPTGDIAKLAQAVNAGDDVSARNILTTGHDVTYTDISTAHPFEPESWVGFTDCLRNHLAAFAASKNPTAALEHLNDFRVLCAVRKGPFGVEAMNDWIKRLLGRQSPQPIMIMRNDEILNVSNGDVGVVMPDEPTNLYLPGRTNPIRIELLPETELSFASTVHKSQGSEFKDVAIVLPPLTTASEASSATDRVNTLLTREILYTAITRTRQRVFLYGSDDAVALCCQQKVARISGLCAPNGR